MEEIKVNDYVRERGEILKIEIFEKLSEYNYESVLVKFKEYAGSNIFTIKEIEKWKHSPNIIDLIEENDYVNGELVEIIYGYDEDGNDKDGNDKEELGIKEVDCEDGYYIPLKNIEIKSIVTHESFNSIKYEVE